jgi:hypothetical protein
MSQTSNQNLVLECSAHLDFLRKKTLSIPNQFANFMSDIESLTITKDGYSISGKYHFSWSAIPILGFRLGELS